MRRRTDKLRQFACEFGRGSEACVEAESTVPKAKSIFFQSREPGSALLSPGFRNLCFADVHRVPPRIGSAVVQITIGQRVGRITGLHPSYKGEVKMLRKITTLALIAGSLMVAACNTVRGAASDVNSAANAVDNAT